MNVKVKLILDAIVNQIPLYQPLQLVYTVKFKTADGGGLAGGLQLYTLPFTQER